MQVILEAPACPPRVGISVATGEIGFLRPRDLTLSFAQPTLGIPTFADRARNISCIFSDYDCHNSPPQFIKILLPLLQRATAARGLIQQVE
jgi:hypothetical protein